MLTQSRNLILFVTFSLLCSLVFGIRQGVSASTPPTVTNEAQNWKKYNQAFGQKISMVSANDGWIMMYTGNLILLFHWDGNKWNDEGMITTPLRSILFADICMVSPDDGWIVLGEPIGSTPSARSIIYRWNGNAWNEFTIMGSPSGTELVAVDMVSATEGWALSVFNSGSIFYHWNDSSWTQHTTIWLPDIIDQDIKMVSSTDGWATGYGGNIYHWNGSTWSKSPSPVASYLHAISFASSTDGWIVGEGGVILHWNGTSWTQFTSPVKTILRSISMVSASAGWAIGGNGNMDDPGVILKWDGISWSRFASFSEGLLMDIDMTSAYDGWITGTSGAYHYEPASLTSNYASGSIGSYFNLTGSGYPPNNPVSITLNNHSLSSSITTDTGGNFTFTLRTSQADPGVYYVTASINPKATASLILDPKFPSRSQDGNWPVIDLPGGLAYQQQFLPLITR